MRSRLRSRFRDPGGPRCASAGAASSTLPLGGTAHGLLGSTLLHGFALLFALGFSLGAVAPAASPPALPLALSVAPSLSPSFGLVGPPPAGREAHRRGESRCVPAGASPNSRHASEVAPELPALPELTPDDLVGEVALALDLEGPRLERPYPGTLTLPARPLIAMPRPSASRAAPRRVGVAPAVVTPPGPSRAASAPAPAAAAPAPVRARVLQRVEPVYPSRCRRRGHTGWVEVEVLVGSGGLAREAAVIRSAGCARLDAAALEAARAFRFLPAHDAGLPTPSREVLEFRFVLR